MSRDTSNSDILLQDQLHSLLDRVQIGAEDPVLDALLDEEASYVARRTDINTLVVNPGSTSTKVDVFNGLKLVARDEVHTPPGHPDDPERRVGHIIEWLEGLGLNLRELSGIAARGGFMAPLPTGTYRVTEDMVVDLAHAPLKHASNMAIPIAIELGRLAGPDVELTVTDPVICDEVDTVQRITGTPAFLTDGAAAHYLNLKAVCTLLAGTRGSRPADMHVIACHMGGGVSAVRFQSGRMVQVAHAFGSMPSANRAGRLPFKDMLLAAAKGRYNMDTLRRDVVESGAGLLGMTGTNDFRALLSFRDTKATDSQREKIDLVINFYANKIAGGIMALAATPEPVDAIVLTGGLARDKEFSSLVESRLHLPAPVYTIPGSIEAESLAAGLLMSSVHPEILKDYRTERDALASRRSEESDLLDTPIFERQPGDHAHESMPANVDELISAVVPRGDLPFVAIVGADNLEALLAARTANQDPRNRLARFALVGNYDRISRMAWELDLPLDGENFVIVDTDDPTAGGVELLREGAVDTLMKGSVTTAEMLHAYLVHLKTIKGSGKKTKLSHVCVFDIPGRSKLLAVTDAAINPSPSPDEREGILENALSTLHTMGLTVPKVAVISATEKPSKKIASSVEGRMIADRFAGREDVIIEGPMSVDLSLSADSAHEKGYRGKVQGDADLLLVPDIDAGNAIYKSLTTTSGAIAAGVVIGGEVPLILTSRGDSARTKLASIALALMLIKRSRGENSK